MTETSETRKCAGATITVYAHRQHMDDELVWVVLRCLTHPLRGWSTVDDIPGETADRIARY